MGRVSWWLVAAAGATGCQSGGSGKPVPPDTVAVAPAPGFGPVSDLVIRLGHSGNVANWPTYGGDLSQRRFSPQNQINTGNVSRLRPAWIYQGGFSESFQSTPLVVGRAMYLTTPMVEQTQRVVKLDALTGRVIWDTPLRQNTTLFCCGPNNRGVAVAGNKVFLATLDARLVAFDADSGKLVWEAPVGDPSKGYGNTSAPVAIGGKVLIGTSGGEWAIRGFLKAFDQETGKLLWTWYTVPSPAEGGWWGDWVEKAPGTDSSLHRNLAREHADSAKFGDSWKRGGAPIWMPATVDLDLGIALVAIGNPNPDYSGVSRPGDNRWSASVCAIKLADGTKAWCFQFVPHDVWDYDGTSPPFLFDLEKDGQKIPAAGLFTKIGWLYVVDRRDGKLITRSDNYVPHKNLFKVPGKDTVEIAPGSAGGTNWSPGAYSPITKLAYTAALDWPMATLGQNGEPCAEGAECGGSTIAIEPGQNSPTRGIMAAVDPATGKVVWQTPTKIPLIGGVVVTAGGLVFGGQSDGSFDAWDAADGRHLWQFRTGAGCNAAPMTFEADRKQFVAVACGGSFILRRSGLESPSGGALIVFALP